MARRSLEGTAASRHPAMPQVVGGEPASGARPTVLRTAWILLAVPQTFRGANGS
jgi:hypothetical protein